jgi:hypothetical protein
VHPGFVPLGVDAEDVAVLVGDPTAFAVAVGDAVALTTTRPVRVHRLAMGAIEDKGDSAFGYIAWDDWMVHGWPS